MPRSRARYVGIGRASHEDETILPLETWPGKRLGAERGTALRERFRAASCCTNPKAGQAASRPRINSGLNRYQENGRGGTGSTRRRGWTDLADRTTVQMSGNWP